MQITRPNTQQLTRHFPAGPRRGRYDSGRGHAISSNPPRNHRRVTPLTFITLGPTGTCHENALRQYLELQGLQDARVVLVEDLLEQGLEQLRGQADTFLVQCSAHLQVHLVTERYHQEVFVVDTFLCPTKELALLVRTDVNEPRSLGIVPATRGYTDLKRWSNLIDEPSKPIVARNLLAGLYDAGLTHLHYADEHPDYLRVEESYGAVDTSWLVYGTQRRLQGRIVGQRLPHLFTADTPPSPIAELFGPAPPTPPPDPLTVHTPPTQAPPTPAVTPSAPG